MKATGFTLRYIAIYAMVFAAVVWVFGVIPSSGVEAATAQTTTWFLALLGHATIWVQADGYTTLTLAGQRDVTVTIVRECTALNVFGVMAGLILPLQASWIRKAKGITVAGLLLFALNIPRIALTVYLTAYDTWPFTLIAERSLDTYHYPISFAFGVIGVAVTILAVSRLTTPELEKTLLGIVDKTVGSSDRASRDSP